MASAPPVARRVASPPALAVLVLLALLAPSPAAAQSGTGTPGSGYALLDEVRAAYRGLAGYHDRGSLRLGDGTLLDFETVQAGDRFRLVLDAGEGRGDERRALWRDEAGVYLQRGDGAVFVLPGLANGLARVLPGDALAAMPAAAILAGVETFTDAGAVALDGETDCDGGRCTVLTLRGAGGLQTLWIGNDDRLVRRVEVEPLAPAVASPIVASFVILAHGGEEVAAALDPAHRPLSPASATATETDTAAASAAAGDAGDEEMPTTAFGEVIDVRLGTVVARVTDSFGDPITDLSPDDFTIAVGGQEVPIVDLSWVTVDASSEELDVLDEILAAGGEVAELSPLASPDVPIVYFFQPDVGNSIRIKGHLRLKPLLENLVSRFAGHPQAVVAFDSHLKLWQDFTDDPERLEAAMWDAMRFGGTPPPRRERRSARDDSPLAGRLSRVWDEAAARRTAVPETALGLLGELLQSLPPGDKIVVYVGWGMGLFTVQGVQDTPDFAPAVRSLLAAGVTVHVLDITAADLHDLSAGLKRIASRTGGTYASTHRFGARAVDHLARNVGGRYLITVDLSGVGAGLLRVEVGDRRATVEADLLRRQISSR